ncbi:putative motility protein [Solibacillus sp. FSL H8-0538]|uniref:putative motility protein n=1 Tax=Solibacillus sp. FSL H8-0538 TaxID=2921400 RepID=UPI0030FAC2C1
MDISSMMSAQVAQLQQTVQMSILDQSLNLGAASAIKMLEDMPEQPVAAHPYKGQVIDVQV